MMNPLVEFCANNLANGSQITKERLEKDSNIDIVEYGCLGYCGQCAYSLFALVDGEMVTGETTDQLVHNIYRFIEEHPMF